MIKRKVKISLISKIIIIFVENTTGILKKKKRTKLLKVIRASLVAQLVKNLPAMLETWVRSLGWKDSLEKGMATHSSILAWRIPWTV